MDYYFLKIKSSKHGQVWKISADAAERIGIVNAKNGPNTYFACDESQTIWQTLASKCPIWFGPDAAATLHKMKLAPGEYYPRMARPLDQHPDESPGYCPGNKSTKNEIATAQGQLVVLTRQLQRICQTIHPNKETLSTFGHDIRNLLILACTEVEAHWRGVLLSNGAVKGNQRLSTNDYVKLATAMKLPEFSVSFPFYPWLSVITPFEKWGSTGSPTEEIEWYGAYNEVKHDRESNFQKATLANAFHAVTACAVMMWAQFGHSNYFGQHSELRAFFQLAKSPKWNPSEVYTFPYGEMHSDWSPKQYDFR